MKLHVELVWEAEEGVQSPSIFLTSDGKILFEGAPATDEERRMLSLPEGRTLIRVDRRFVEAVKTLL
ncbi:hypothetical protein J2J97_29075 (plasmid) [Rhizobium bangladeshense]|uniref:hypothetical protein n=1 Tax=Rhizobium bangladeshense TaxID=1138189 RepID=UPI001A9A20DE|nr:hypothetical protein [Rhizobium bangladeshense]QSY97867.1 hypothetical protein J2J97_29075 [Rhizobium bangladeshense]